MKGPLLMLFALVSLVISGLTGCTSARVSISHEEKLSGYHTVYLVQTPNSELIVQTNIANRLRKSGFDVVDIKAGNGPTGSQGSGFVVTEDGSILTCAHVVGLQTNATVWIQGRRYPGKVVAADTKLDAAVIKVDSKDHKFRPLPILWKPEYHMGDAVYTMGFPLAEMLGNTPRLSKGLISSPVGLKDDPRQVQISAEVQAGNSGGPLLNEHGEAIGMVDATLNTLAVLFQTGGSMPQNVNFAIKSATLQEFLGEHAPTVPLIPPNAGTNGLDGAKDSVVLVRAGIVEDKDLNAPALVCNYIGYYDPLLRIRVINLVFSDSQTGQRMVMARADSQKYRARDAVENMLDEIFAQIYPKFFPDKKNPF